MEAIGGRNRIEARSAPLRNEVAGGEAAAGNANGRAAGQCGRIGEDSIRESSIGVAARIGGERDPTDALGGGPGAKRGDSDLLRFLAITMERGTGGREAKGASSGQLHDAVSVSGDGEIAGAIHRSKIGGDGIVDRAKA